jgi:hypothetical protein
MKKLLFSIAVTILSFFTNAKTSINSNIRSIKKYASAMATASFTIAGKWVLIKQ